MWIGIGWRAVGVAGVVSESAIRWLFEHAVAIFADDEAEVVDEGLELFVEDLD